MPVPLPFILIPAYLLDMVLGDPEGLFHPVRLIGRVITRLEGLIRRIATGPAAQRAGGVVLALTVVGSAYGASWLLLSLASGFSTVLYYLLAIYMVYSSLAVKSLGDEAEAVLEAMEKGGIEGGRIRVSRIVGRDTGNLSEGGVLRATAETVAENSSDGVVAPLFYLAIGGPPLMLAYKAVNTLDSMVGYRNERYRHLGWFSARLDDACNFIPARIAAVLTVIGALVLGYNWRGSWRVLRSDGRKHPSPNSGMPEAAFAGALGLRFGGGASYGGVFHEKPFIGEGSYEATPGSVRSAVRLMKATALLMVAGVAAAWGLAIFLL